MSLYEFEIRNIQGQLVPLNRYQGQVLLIVNVASQCGFTPQYEGLQQLYETYHHKGFQVLAFPCNQFGGQEPGSDSQIQSFCTRHYSVDFPLFAKINVNGHNAHPLYVWLKKQQTGLLGRRIKWNFTKFLVDRHGQVRRRYAPAVKPAKIARDLVPLLHESA